MKQNIYDDPGFFAGYATLRRSTDGLAGAPEWPLVRSLLPDLEGKRVLDLGCGFGALCRHLAEAGARQVIGIDLSEKMLAAAAERTSDPRIEYRRGAVEDLDLASGAFDLVVSSLVLHYVERVERVFAAVHELLVPAGSFVLMVEHPIYTSRAEQAWQVDAEGRKLHWAVDGYQMEGVRHVRWFADDVIKYHRTVATYVNALIDAGFVLTRLHEPDVPAEAIAQRPELADERRRPMFLLLAAVRR
jgi:2-polyprenyl-3-methyl-5-hydroxy-6-metoxy-1,4-benzoquinol methylase